jgi:hypothetical protein
MKKTLLEIVKVILSKADSQDVNSISDTEESMQAAETVQSVYEDMIANRVIPEHKSIIKLTSLSDNDFPTHFIMEENQHKVETIWYDTSTDGSFQYTEMMWLEPEDFLRLVDKRQSNYDSVDDKFAGTKLRIANDSMPKWYTSFDDDHIVFDAYNSTVENTLQTSKTRAIATTYPVFTLDDDFVPDLDSNMFPYLQRESESMFFDVYKGAISVKIEQAAKRHKNYSQNDKMKIGAIDKKRNYGRR